MAEFERIKVAALAKDLGVKGKDITASLLKAGIEKPVSGLLDEDEINYVFEHFSNLYPVGNINEFIAGEYALKLSEKELAARKAEKQKQETQKKLAREKAQKQKHEEEKILEKERLEKAGSAAAKAVPHQKDRAQTRAKQLEDRFAGARPSLKTSDKTDRKKSERQQKPAAPSAVERAFQQPSSSLPKEVVTAKKDIRIVDTRIVDINLDKYDEKLYAYASEGRIDRKRRPPRRPRRRNDRRGGKKAEPIRASRPDTILLPEELAVSDLAREMRITTGEVLKKLLMTGFKANANQFIDFDTAAIIADEFGVEALPKKIVTIEDQLIDTTKDEHKELIHRSPVVVVMGHVDHGKTSLLDAIRHSNVTVGEAGGITQHIGAYRINVKGKDITFLDTPGHEAFTAMRARGAQITDIAILVVAADDGIMPQTVEAINHAKAAGVTIIVAINKMDKPGARPEEIKQGLSKYELIPEEWGGDVICVPVSALTKKGVDELLESILLVAEVAELKANPDRRASGVVIEAKLDRGRGTVATLLIQNGTLNVGDIIIAGGSVGRVRAMNDDKGNELEKAGPSVPVEVLGLTDVPNAGDIFNAVDDERMARDLARQRKDKIKEDEFTQSSKVSLEELFNQLKEGQKELNIIIKADVQGSAGALTSSLEKLTCDEVKVKVIHSGVGGVSESDVMLADASNAIIVGFNVRPDKGALESADLSGVDIRTYRVIYECIEEIEAAIKGMLAPKYREVVLGRAEVRQTIKVPGIGFVAGSYVIDGKVTRNSMIRVLRDSVVIFEDKISSLRRFKDDVREVAQGFECGIALDKFKDIKVGDVLEAYIMEEIKQ